MSLNPFCLKTFSKKLAMPLAALALMASMAAPVARAESCSVSTEMDDATKSALRTTAVQDYQFVAAANGQSVVANATPDVAGNPAAVQQLLDANKADLAGSTATARNTFLLDATGGQPVLDHAEFFCGVFNSPLKIGFTMQNLPAGKYGLVVLDVHGSKVPYFYTVLLKQDGGAWKIAGLFPRSRQFAGHDAQWYWQQARDYKSKGEVHDAYFYYLIARDMAAPVPFMSTTKLDNFYDEVQKSIPPDVPEKNPVTIADGGKQYQVTSMFVVPNDNGAGLDLVMKYNATTDVNDAGKTFLENKQAMKALMAKYPELKDPFQNLVARAVAPSGQDYGSVMPIKDLLAGK